MMQPMLLRPITGRLHLVHCFANAPYVLPKGQGMIGVFRPNDPTRMPNDPRSLPLVGVSGVSDRYICAYGYRQFGIRLTQRRKHCVFPAIAPR